MQFKIFFSHNPDNLKFSHISTKKNNFRKIRCIYGIFVNWTIFIVFLPINQDKPHYITSKILSEPRFFVLLKKRRL